jgi:hypothetical protein
LVFHASEIFKEDGVLMLGIEPMMRGITLPKQYYNVVLHEWIKVYIECFKPIFSVSNDENWSNLAQISGYSREHIVACIGLDDADFRVASIHHFFHFQTNFQAQLPQLYNEYRLVFYQNEK